MFVPTSNELYRQFRRALRAQDFWEAMKAAKALPGLLSLLDALELTLLAAEVEEGKIYDDLAARWVARATVEEELPLPQQARAVEVFQAAGRGEAEDAFGELSAYACRKPRR
jgi:HPt (histidine-containing phosphotransfer) domain-containing protein